MNQKTDVEELVLAQEHMNILGTLGGWKSAPGYIRAEFTQKVQLVHVDPDDIPRLWVWFYQGYLAAQQKSSTEESLRRIELEEWLCPNGQVYWENTGVSPYDRVGNPTGATGWLEYQPVTALCIYCGDSKPITELNGTGFGPNPDHSSAYCRRLVDCDSDHSRQTIARLREALGVTDETEI